jgi:large subunit ribosomal protein L13
LAGLSSTGYYREDSRHVHMKTYSPKPTDFTGQWYLVDAAGLTLGRMASRVAHILRGKHRPQFAPHFDPGDHVVVVNASQIRVTGRKLQQKVYQRYSGYPGGLKEVQLLRLMQTNPARVVEIAVKGMLPKNRLGRKLFRHLCVYAGPDHPHAAQDPTPITLSV